MDIMEKQKSTVISMLILSSLVWGVHGQHCITYMKGIYFIYEINQTNCHSYQWLNSTDIPVASHRESSNSPVVNSTCWFLESKKNLGDLKLEIESLGENGRLIRITSDCKADFDRPSPREAEVTTMPGRTNHTREPDAPKGEDSHYNALLWLLVIPVIGVVILIYCVWKRRDKVKKWWSKVKFRAVPQSDNNPTHCDV